MREVLYTPQVLRRSLNFHFVNYSFKSSNGLSHTRNLYSFKATETDTKWGGGVIPAMLTHTSLVPPRVPGFSPDAKVFIGRD